MKFFSSSATNKVDAKGRVSIPAPFRKVLAAEGSPALYLRPEVQGKPAIEGFGETYFDKEAAALEQMQPTDPAFEALADLMISRTSSMPLDETGRIVLPAALREAAGIEGEAIFVGRIRTFQIWKPENYYALQSDMRATAEANFDKMPWGSS